MGIYPGFDSETSYRLYGWTVGFDVFPLPASSAMMYWLFISRERSMWNGRVNSKLFNSIISVINKSKTWNIVIIINRGHEYISFLIAMLQFGWVGFTSCLAVLTVSGKNRFSTISAPDNPVSKYFYAHFILQSILVML